MYTGRTYKLLYSRRRRVCTIARLKHDWAAAAGEKKKKSWKFNPTTEIYNIIIYSGERNIFIRVYTYEVYRYLYRYFVPNCSVASNSRPFLRESTIKSIYILYCISLCIIYVYNIIRIETLCLSNAVILCANFSG